jgi:uncharacterized protein (DUF433 family)
MTAPFHPRITIELGKCGGKPCIRGMRIRVSDVLELLANGASSEEILADYPCLERDDILAAIAYPRVDSTHPQRCTFRPPRAALFNRCSHLHRFVNRRRILRSLETLKNDVSLASVALDLGFSSQSHFAWIFSGLTGMTPANFRKSVKRTVA